MVRVHGRVTKDDVRSAGLRRWNGRRRITTDWVNLFHEPELFWPDGDCLVYLREPGQSSRGPAFRIHSSQLKGRGFETLLDKCITRAAIHTSTKCIMNNCSGCGKHTAAQELYIPAPAQCSLEDTFDHHITTRNFFAWLYNLPLAGRALGKSLVSLRDRINTYRSVDVLRNKLEVTAYAESQRYLDFRECVDHALAALHVAEAFEIEDLWVDAFAHCVGLNHRGLRDSIEYEAISPKSRIIIIKARLEVDVRLDRVSRSVRNFFENDLSGNFLGLSQAARDHFDRFRSFLHAFYIEQHGFWPPENFGDEGVQRSIYAIMYSDFRNLYHHLVDPKTSSKAADNDISTSGGVCAMQNVQAFDVRHHYEALPKPLPMIPTLSQNNMPVRGQTQRRNSWNPLQKRKVDRDSRNARCVQALIDSTNRDWAIMDCLLVRRYSEFELESIVDEFESISMVDGRKVRWVLIYAVLQTLISVMQAPRQVRNTEGLSYSLCCHAPKVMPWVGSSREVKAEKRSPIMPDTGYSHTNAATSHSGSMLTRAPTARDRRQSLSTISASAPANKTPPSSRSTSLRRLVTRRSQTLPDGLLQKRASFCEIYMQGYGNGLNEVEIERSESPTSTNSSSSDTQKPKSEAETETRPVSEDHKENSPAGSEEDKDMAVSSASPSPSVSRESSNASNSSTWSKGSTTSDSDVSTPGPSPLSLKEILQTTRIMSAERPSTAVTEKSLRILDEFDEMRTVHINTKTWDEFLGLPVA